jgi:hypothetical protein
VTDIIKPLLLILCGEIAGAGLMRLYDRSHIAPVVIGQSIPGLPCMITDEVVKDCAFSGFPSSWQLSSSVRIGDLTIMQAPLGVEAGHEYQKDERGGLHQLPPRPTY